MSAASVDQSKDIEPGQSFRETDVEDGFVKISKLAVASTVLGVLSIFALVALSLLPLCFVAVILGIVALVRIHRDDALGGSPFAYVGIAIAVTAGCWSFTSNRVQNNYLYRTAGEHAQAYLEILAAGDTYQAMELRKLEPNRQMSGTQLELVYAGSESQSSTEMRQFLEKEVTQSVLQAGSDSDWEFVRGVGIQIEGDETQITVQMRNAEQNMQQVNVTLGRIPGVVLESGQDPVALWYVIDESLPGQK